jgi:GH43 family beta-xylosidase
MGLVWIKYIFIKMMTGRKVTFLLFILGICSISEIAVSQSVNNLHKTSYQGIDAADLRIRDPFILADENSETYYLYRQIANGRGDSVEGVRGVEVYQSKNLKIWTGPQIVFRQPEDFWANAQVWAPEVHIFQGKYYLFVTFSANRSLNSDGAPWLPVRGTQILVSNSPVGPFEAFENKAHTPNDWSSLDGTMWVEENVPWMIFCHEWTQIGDGAVELLQLKPDLSAPAGKPQLLFHASEAPWSKNLKDLGFDSNGLVTDGPFLFRTKIGKLLMIWSSFGSSNYAVGIAESESGKVTGPWKQQSELLFKADGGHAMIFTTFQGQLMLCLHQPNKRQTERMKLFKLEDLGTTLRLSSVEE